MVEKKISNKWFRNISDNANQLFLLIIYLACRVENN